MSKNKGSHARAASPDARGAARSAAPAIQFLPPLRPQKKLMLLLGTILIAWMIVLLVFYFKTVYPTRHDSPRLPNEPNVLSPR